MKGRTGSASSEKYFPFGVIVRIGLLATCLKLLLIPSQTSTDFEVHRHWLSLTSSLPITEWYRDESSKWTLDYPPLFAYYTLLLSKLAPYFDPEMLILSNHDYTSPRTNLFLRLSVALNDMLFVSSMCTFLYAYLKKSAKDLSTRMLRNTAVLILFNPGLLVIDNIHFQYNTLPLSFLLFSLAAVLAHKKVFASVAFIFALHIKHTLLPATPVLYLYLLFSSTITELLRIGIVSAVAVATIWAPLLLHGWDNIHPVFYRLFPFGRGLLHSYWAPNLWAVYATADKVLSKVAVPLGLKTRIPDIDPASGFIGGLQPFRFLPNIDPKTCAAFTLLSIAPILFLAALYGKEAKGATAMKRPRQMVDMIGISFLCAFTFGFHVHEKAILCATVLLSATAITPSTGNVRWEYAVVAVGGHYALLPLINESNIVFFKLMCFATYQTFLMSLLPNFTRGFGKVLWLWILVEIYAGAEKGHVLMFGRNNLQYVPTIVIALYSACHVLAATLLYWMRYVKDFLRCVGVQDDTWKRKVQ